MNEPMIRAIPVVAAFALILLQSTATGQIVTENAGITSPETPTLRESFSYRDTTRSQSFLWSHELRWGLTRSMELGLTVPTIPSQRVEFKDGSGRRLSKRIGGLGDTTLAFKKSVYQTDDILESTRWAVLANVVLPTGDEDRSTQGVELPSRLQLGSGSWGFGGGSAFTVIRNRHRVSAEAKYLHQTRHNGVRPGPELDFNLAYWYRLSPAVFEPGLHQVEIRPVFEILSHYRFSSRSNTGRIRDDGWIVAVAPGLQVYPRENLLFELNVEVPVFQNIDDAIGHRRWGLSFAVKFLF